jgi:ribosomal-protein-alanine N-acetyltransferase
MPGRPHAAGQRHAPSLRLYSEADFEQLYRIDQACYPPGIAYNRRMLRWYPHQPGAACLVAHAAGEILGFILTDRNGPEGHIVTIDVLAENRRSGIGSALLREAEHALAESGVRDVALETATSNDAAIAFWQRHGYRTAGVLPNYYSTGADAFFMRKTL